MVKRLMKMHSLLGRDLTIINSKTRTSTERTFMQVTWNLLVVDSRVSKFKITCNSTKGKCKVTGLDLRVPRRRHLKLNKWYSSSNSQC